MQRVNRPCLSRVRVAGRGATAPPLAQRLGERPVVLGQARRLPGELIDALVQGFGLHRLLLALLPQGRDLRGLLLLLRVLLGQPPQGCRQLLF